MIPEHYYKLICCPKCKTDLDKISYKNELYCQNCKSKYPVIEDIPILLHEVKDEISQIIKEFYDTEWKRNRNGILRAKVKHEDLSTIGQQYIKKNENRFLKEFETEYKQIFFLDAASGAQPRVNFSDKYTYHICVDFSLDGMIECKRLLGDKSICICGSLLEIPLKDLSCDGIIASHVLYHVDKDLQKKVIRQLYRVLRPGGKLLIFYANPDSMERKIIKGLKKLIGRKAINIKSSNKELYYYAHPINYMQGLLFNEFDKSKCIVRSLRMFTPAITKKLFSYKILGTIIFNVIITIEKILRRYPNLSSYVVYIATK